MNRRLGGAAATRTTGATTDADTIEPGNDWRITYLRKQLEVARSEAGTAAARFALLCRSPDTSAADLAQAADDAALRAGRVRCFSTLLSRQ